MAGSHKGSYQREKSLDTARLVKQSGIVTIVTGVLLCLLGILPSLMLPRESMLEAVLDPQWYVFSILAFVLIVITTISVLGIYVRLLKETGTLGLLGFLLMLIGLLLSASIQFDLAVVWPILAQEVPEMLPPGGPMYSDTAFLTAHALFNSFTFFGFMIFGIALIRARVFPIWAALLFTIGMPFSAGILFPPLILRAFGAVLGAAGLIRIGYFLWTEEIE